MSRTRYLKGPAQVYLLEQLPAGETMQFTSYGTTATSACESEATGQPEEG